MYAINIIIIIIIITGKKEADIKRDRQTDKKKTHTHLVLHPSFNFCKSTQGTLPANQKVLTNNLFQIM